MGIMLFLITSATIVELLIIYLLSAPSLVMRRSARRLVMHVLWQKRTLRGVEVDVEAVEAVVDVELVVKKGNVLLGMMTAQRKAPYLVS
jgi:hypothetical protein